MVVGAILRLLAMLLLLLLLFALLVFLGGQSEGEEKSRAESSRGVGVGVDGGFRVGGAVGDRHRAKLTCDHGEQREQGQAGDPPATISPRQHVGSGQ